MNTHVGTSGFGSGRIAGRLRRTAWNTTWNESRLDTRIETWVNDGVKPGAVTWKSLGDLAWKLDDSDAGESMGYYRKASYRCFYRLEDWLEYQ